MRLYHYLEARWGLENIQRQRLKLSKINDMNDPYEFKSVYSEDAKTQAGLRQTELQVAEKYGVLCFSRSRTNILMWSHYAEKHKGICLGFDVSEERTREVRYVEVPIGFGRFDNLPASLMEFAVDQNLGAKYDGWRYEEEVRVHGSQAERDENGLYFVAFNEGLALKEVIVGVRFTGSIQEIEDALRAHGDGVAVAKARCSIDQFEIVVDGRFAK